MIEVLRSWYARHFSDPQAVILAISLLVGFAIIFFLGDVLTPVIAAIVIAYVLEGLVKKLQALKVPHLIAVTFVVILFLFFVLIMFLGLVPLFSKQLTQFFVELPNMLAQGQKILMTLPEQYPFISPKQIQDIVYGVQSELASFGQKVVSVSLASAINVFTLLVYMVVVPLLVFFFLKDKEKIIAWLMRFLPSRQGLASIVWHEVDRKIGNYIRGKLLEVVIVGIATYLPLKLMGLNYAALLSFLVGLSVIIPYVGAVAVTIPVALIAYFQWGWTSDFLYLLLFYGGVQFLDGNLLVPLLFSEVVNMHPAAIIIAVLVFGGLWGVWGVFFAIPLATLIQTVINSWPTSESVT
ncbi:MAG: AI-2E family transporter, partial [Gammaproteobacteria bacterium]|nr:AI-2E family transporter [Gammaproteobacteria bacterium]MDH5734885.1 AI-2E family transporter [Gammaproteobacteria bacterium]